MNFMMMVVFFISLFVIFLVSFILRGYCLVFYFVMGLFNNFNFLNMLVLVNWWFFLIWLLFFYFFFQQQRISFWGLDALWYALYHCANFLQHFFELPFILFSLLHHRQMEDLLCDLLALNFVCCLMLKIYWLCFLLTF